MLFVKKRVFKKKKKKITVATITLHGLKINYKLRNFKNLTIA